MSNNFNNVVPEYNTTKVSRIYESHNKLPQTGCNIPMPKIKSTGEKICENCNKEDVCKYKEDYMKAVKDILDIEGRKNVFIKTEINCKKWSAKFSVNADILYR